MDECIDFLNNISHTLTFHSLQHDIYLNISASTRMVADYKAHQGGEP